uniref:OSJNBa0059H15.19 protein n=1 Tax=Oryza sativa subsp. japonica TaxID=39947 RepID=Q7X7T2_ORYSJ|nr:OSJNBa0070D17.6 [Oryza sativa Japonica Group]CAE05436.2 OSJNBa0059H15.19 [Oryza sativa Japonica Group]
MAEHGGALIVGGADGNESLGRGARVVAIRGVKGGDGGHGDSCGHGFGERRRKEKAATGARGRRRGAGSTILASLTRLGMHGFFEAGTSSKPVHEDEWTVVHSA